MACMTCSGAELMSVSGLPRPALVTAVRAREGVMSKVIYEKDGRIGRITLNRPEVMNAIDDDVPVELAVPPHGAHRSGKRPRHVRLLGEARLHQEHHRIGLGDRCRTPPPDRRKQGPIQFLENNPIQSSFWVRFKCPKTRRNWLRLPIVRFHPGSSCPQAAALRRSHTRGRRPPPFSARSRVSWHTVNLRSAPSSRNHPNIRTLSRLFRRPHA
jgi:hypothetical protein